MDCHGVSEDIGRKASRLHQTGATRENGQVESVPSTPESKSLLKNWWGTTSE